MTTPPSAVLALARACTCRCTVASRRVARRGSSRTVFREGGRCGPGDTAHRRWVERIRLRRYSSWVPFSFADRRGIGAFGIRGGLIQGSGSRPAVETGIV
jgi:hypothetical protein